jgi:hypothetical protein
MHSASSSQHLDPPSPTTTKHWVFFKEKCWF